MLTQIWLFHIIFPAKFRLQPTIAIAVVQKALFYERAWDMRDGHYVPEKLDNIIVGLKVIGLV